MLRARARSTPSPCSRYRPGCGDGKPTRTRRLGSSADSTSSAGASRDRADASSSPFIAQYCVHRLCVARLATCQAFAVHCCAVTRKYELNRRAERQAETRKRIVEATVGLHTSVGPATRPSPPSPSGRACSGTRSTRTFATSATLFDACSAHWAALHPFPDAARWTTSSDPSATPAGGSGRRLRVVRTRRGRPGDLQARLRRPRDDGRARRAREHGLLALEDALAGGWSRRKPVRAAIGHALELETWHSLVRRHGLTREQAVDAMLRFVSSV